MEETKQDHVIVPALGICILLCIGVFVSFRFAKSNPGTIVLPGGITYLGPTPTKQPETTLSTDGTIPVPADAKWVERNGTLFPYSFLYPEPLSLGVFPNDPYDSVTVFYPGTDPNTNIFLRVDDLTALNKKQFIGKTESYANSWWKDYTWSGVGTVTTFTNSHGLKGFRASYRNDRGETPYDHVFFEIPGNQNLVLWISGRLFSPDVFSKLVDSVSWTP